MEENLIYILTVRISAIQAAHSKMFLNSLNFLDFFLYQYSQKPSKNLIFSNWFPKWENKINCLKDSNSICLNAVGIGLHNEKIASSSAKMMNRDLKYLLNLGICTDLSRLNASTFFLFLFFSCRLCVSFMIQWSLAFYQFTWRIFVGASVNTYAAGCA